METLEIISGFFYNGHTPMGEEQQSWKMRRIGNRMVFSSIEFIYFFLPLFLLIYYMLPGSLKNAGLFLGSMVFYTIGSWKSPEHVILFAFSLIINYCLGRLVERYNSKAWFVLGIGINLVQLGLFKYVLHILPVGISFYTFQAISYLCDVRRRKCVAEKSFINFGTYLSMFPQLIAGPIVKYPDIRAQIQDRQYRLSDFVQGLQVFVIGLGSKVLLANRVGVLWSQLSVIGYESVSTPLAWLGLFSYTFQIYFDFWGYSLMAIGLGKMLGFDLPVNFDYPYLSTSMTEFWRRWHITLGSWFKEYVYIPLGGNRGSKARVYRNLFVVWLLTGIWHGAGLNFVLWGLILFILIVLEKAGLKKFLDKWRLLGHAYMAVFIPLTWAVFANSDWQQMILFFKRLFDMGGTAGSLFVGDYIKYGREYGFYMLVCLVFITRLPSKIWSKIKDTYVGQVILSVMFVAVVYCLYIGLDNPFLYYQF